MDFRNFAGDLFEDLAAPLFGERDGGYGGYGFGARGGVYGEDAEGGGLRGAEAEEHGLGFFGVAGLGLGGLVWWFV